MSSGSRSVHLDTLEPFLSASPTATSADALLAVGRAARVSHCDDLDLVRRADELLGRPGLKRLAGLSDGAVQAFSDTLVLSDQEPAALFAALERAGALLAGAQLVSLQHPALEQLKARAEAASRLAPGEAPTGRRRIALALLANEHIAEHGVVPGVDDAILTLADALTPALQAAFRGDRIDTMLGSEPRTEGEGPRPLVTHRTRRLATEEIARLGRLLATALDLGDEAQPLKIAPELLELTPFFLATSAPELVLHEDDQDEPALVSEPLPGVALRVHLDVLEIELSGVITGAYPEPVLLPLVGDSALTPCRCRTGQTARHFVFEPSDHPAVDAYALLLGDQVAVLRA